eukprot:CAMPEP_0184375654 /NCGR_PEP_ID=MMETSP0007-20130409/723_1 /TAXON_ID=97485 /ORGANISM="Prymnesium parvum, Strain Texoma1" /LENGTH=88 /DNA_ID=CAMNT_0026718869 /DNA_START=20 /DNA_END=289 /DNA_ORIENTATION=+
MPCSYCHKSNHNIRTCPAFDADKIAEMIAEGAAKQEVFRALDCGLPGFGAGLELVDRLYGSYRHIRNLNSMTKNERKRAALGLIYDAS